MGWTKSSGPAFSAQKIELRHCLECHGRAFIRGIFHDLACVACNASGWVEAATGHALSLEALVPQLSLRLQGAERALRNLQRASLGPQQQYEQNNRLGAGGTNYTGD
ncbi:hypothetical protein NUH87_26715 [Pseudomonas batumici]|uniref:hypothetical protein n=1 Tax=Pseudomonas batumici TaxID=226910 RepID=UPI0030D24C97